MSRQIILDTETTGIGHENGHRIIEIGCVEMVERKLTGKHFHVYLNPEREIDEGAFRVHGISHEFLKDKPRFSDVYDDFIQFIEGSELIIHNAPFDVGFLNAELKRLETRYSLENHCSVLDTLVLAREMHPGQRNSLDALCKRYEVDNSKRDLHGALLDAEILAFVYLAMTGGQSTFSFETLGHQEEASKQDIDLLNRQDLSNQTPIIAATTDEVDAHKKIVALIIESSDVNHWE